MSLHSSPSSVLASLGTCSPLNPSSPTNDAEPGGSEADLCEAREGALGAKKTQTENTEKDCGSGVEGSLDSVSPTVLPISDGDLEQNEDVTEVDSPCHNNNKDTDAKETSQYHLRRGNGE